MTHKSNQITQFLRDLGPASKHSIIQDIEQWTDDDGTKELEKAVAAGEITIDECDVCWLTDKKWLAEQEEWSRNNIFRQYDAELEINRDGKNGLRRTGAA